jgi:NADPH-dependent 2,4-dienoyl-CoA reductase/sulfur reductase-like enzyme
MMAVLNPNITHTMVDGGVFTDEVKSLNIMAVPSIYLNGEFFASGRQELDQLLAKIDTGSSARAAEKLKDVAPYDVLIVGGGPAGVNCAEALRQSDFTGEITVISAEDIVAYDRTLLTKVLPTGDATKFKLRGDDFLKNADIDFLLSTRAESVDTTAKTVKLSNGETIHYDKLCIATGTSPFRPRVQGIDYKNVFVLRSHNDQEQIKKLAATAKKVVILGSGFIGSESASSLKLQYKDAMEVSIVSMEAVPFQRQFGLEVGKMFLAEHEKNGVKMFMSKKLKEIRGEGDQAKTVVLEDGTEIEADLVLVGTGVLPATKFLEGSGIQLDKWGGVVCDPFLQTSVKDVYAAGDIASYPYWATGQRMRIEHYMTAMDQGSYSAFNMLGKMVPFGNVPFFWTRNYNKAVQYIGNASDYDEVYI